MIRGEKEIDGWGEEMEEKVIDVGKEEVKD